MARRKAKPKNDDALGYDERVKIPEGADPDVELVIRTILDVPRPKDGQATSEDGTEDEDSTGR